jgi:methionyl-tRNA formyltransferase
VRVVFLGSQEIGARCLEVILEQGHEVVGVGTFRPGPHEQWMDDVARVVRDRGLPSLRGRRFRTRKAIGELRHCHPDILFAIGWRWILPPEILAIPPRGCLGIHGSLLPRLRGFAPVNWALIRDEPRTGPSLFYFDEGTDTGDLVGQRPFEITDEDDAASVRRRIADAAVGLLAEHLPGLAAGTAPRLPQPAGGATYGPRRRPEDGVIDWGWEPRRLFNWVRGLTRPYPGAIAAVGGRPVRVWRVRPAEAVDLAPGELERRDDGRLLVGAGEGTVEILDASFEGAEGEDAFADFARALRLEGRFEAKA